MNPIDCLGMKRVLKEDDYSSVGKSRAVHVDSVKRGSTPSAPGGSLWAEKWRPKSLSDLVGNPGVIEKLKIWLNDWNSVVIQGNKKPVNFKFGNTENLNARAVLISGPPGIGKTTTARLVCEILGFEPLEFNASDSRGKNTIEELSRGAGQCKSLNHYFTKPGATAMQSTTLKKGSVLIFDECDGLSAGDRGGSQAMIQLIKTSTIPVICICNDRMHTKVRSLANSCLDLRFARTQKSVVARRMHQIAQKEGLNMSLTDIEDLAEETRGDCRQILNTMQLNYLSQKRGDSNSVTAGGKDAVLALNPFDACAALFSSTPRTINELMDFFFIDSDLIPLMVQENYLNGNMDTRNPAQSLRLYAQAAEFISDGDIFSRCVYQGQNWGLMPQMAVASAIAPTALVRAAGGSCGRTNFPAWLGKNSTTNKSKRLVSELKTVIWPVSPLGGLTAYGFRKLDFVETLLARFLKPLQAANVAENPQAAALESCKILDAYYLPREFIVEHCRELLMKGVADEYQKIDSKVKTSLTRTYNSTSHVIKVALAKSSSDIKKGSKNDDGLDYLNGDDEEADEENGEKEEDVFADGLIEKRKAPAAKAKAKAKSAGPKAKAKAKAAA